MKMKYRNNYCGHSNRIFALKFDPINSNILVSGGWDNTVWIYDIREKGPVGGLFGPHISGESIDIRKDSSTILTGSYREENVLELWDIRTLKKFREIDWDG